MQIYSKKELRDIIIVLGICGACLVATCVAKSTTPHKNHCNRNTPPKVLVDSSLLMSHVTRD